MAPSQNERTTPASRQRTRQQSQPATRAQRGDRHAAARIASLNECRTELQDNHLARTREVLAYRDKALALVEELKETCRELLRREEACLNRLEFLSPTPSELIPFRAALQDLRKPIPERLVFAKNGVVISFSPEEDEEQDEDEVMDAEVDTISNHTSPDMPASTSISEEAHDNAGPPTTSRERRARIAASINVLAPDTVSSRRFSRPKHKRRIRPREVKSGHYWVFEHSSDGNPSNMYTLRCPNETCETPVFSRHPLKENRAVAHFKNCGVRFKNLSDLVCRYADLVVRDRPSRPLSRKWAKEHNENLIGMNEHFLRAENVWPGIDKVEEEVEDDDTFECDITIV